MDNIRKKTRTQPTELTALFEFRVGSLPYQKPSELVANYRAIIAPYPASEALGKAYANTHLRGGAIYNIFWLHCMTPRVFPIFDQHVYRAMMYTQTGSLEELPLDNRKRMAVYWNAYVPFFKNVKKGTRLPQRTIDRGLFTMGQFLKRYGRPI